MEPLKTYWLEPANKTRRSLRRYRSSNTSACTCGGYCDAQVLLDIVDDENKNEGKTIPHDDPRWPTHCEACKQPFVDTDEWQVFQEALYTDSRNGNLVGIRDAEPGATWDASWYHDAKGWTGPDGLSIIAKCPDGATWTIDGTASNCTKPDDLENKCWVRHGDPRKCELTVDKNGNTCAAGAGSILTGSGWHGFLRNGYFVLA